VVHWMIGVHLVDQPDFDPVPNRERPSRIDPFTAPVSPSMSCPNYVARIKCPTDLRHQMLPLETIAVIMAGGSALRRGGNSVGGNQLHAALRTPGGH
jgi:hypothetical protein